MKYERLTDKNDLYWALQETKLSAEVGIYLTDCLNRLADIEDKKEQGTLIELPCKVGDTVYFPVYESRWDCAEIDLIHITDKEIIFEWVQYDRGYELTELWDNGEFTLEDIGKTVFLTREEAEKRLKEIQNG